MSCNINMTEIIHACDNLETLQLILDATKDRIDILSPVPQAPTPADIALSKMIEVQKAKCQVKIDQCVSTGSRIYITVHHVQLIPYMKEYFQKQGYVPIHSNDNSFFLDFK
jgi:hypothetical protein